MKLIYCLEQDQNRSGFVSRSRISHFIKCFKIHCQPSVFKLIFFIIPSRFDNFDGNDAISFFCIAKHLRDDMRFLYL